MTLDDAPATLLHIGCGYASEWRKTGFPARFGRIVLVEPNPACLGDLRDLAETDPRVQVIGAAVAANDGQADFHLMSFEDLSGFGPVGKLRALMPGLVLVQKVAVRCMSVATLLIEAGLTDKPAETQGDVATGAKQLNGAAPRNAGADTIGVAGGDMLFLEAMGLESAILRDLAAAGALARFAGIRVRLARAPLLSSNFDPDSAATFMSKQGFAVEGSDADPDLPHLMFRRDANLMSMLAQAEALEAAKSEVDRVGGLLKDSEIALAKALDGEMALASRVIDLEIALAAETAEVRKLRDAQEALRAETARQTAISHEKDAAVTAAKAAQFSTSRQLVETETRANAAEDALATLRGQQDAAMAESARLSDLITEKDNALEAAAADIAMLRAREAALTDELHTLRAQHEADSAEIARLADTAVDSATEDLRKTQTRLETQLADAQADLRLTMRMHAIAGGDLQDLKTRYAEVLARKNSQDQLIAQLVLRLEEASEHLQALTLTAAPDEETETGQARPAQGARTLAPVAVTAPPTPVQSRKDKTRKPKASLS